LTAEAVGSSVRLLNRFGGSPDVVRAGLLESVPLEVAYFSDGSAALAADTYADERELAGVRSRFTALPVAPDRVVQTRRGVAWAAQPLYLVRPDRGLVAARLAEVVQAEVAYPNRETTLSNRRRDPDAAGWRRVARDGACKFCRMLAARGAVYTSRSAYFASHPACHCVAQPVWSTDDTVQVSAIQFIGSKRNRTPADRARLNSYLSTFD
jgi:hypothetical protein